MRPNRSAGIGVPRLPDWGRNLLVGLFALYALELFGRNILGLPVDQLAWFPFRSGFAPWQPLTHFLIQGNGVFGVVISGFVLALLLPTIQDFDRRKLAEFFGWAAGIGILVAGLLDGMGILRGPALGWSSAVTALIVLFGLRNPNAQVLLFFVLPVQASLFVWGTGVISFLLLLASPTLASAEYFGVFLGVMAWWNLRGPAARRRQLAKKAANIERELRNFQVIEGGRNRGDDDDIVH